MPTCIVRKAIKRTRIIGTDERESPFAENHSTRSAPHRKRPGGLVSAVEPIGRDLHDYTSAMLSGCRTANLRATGAQKSFCQCQYYAERFSE